MSRTERLLELLQSFRRRRYAASGRLLADELGVSLRTLYRDIATLKSQGVPIEGESGVGFLLKPGYTLPPLMFSREEIEALVLGARLVIDRGDEELVSAARDALAKIRSVVPPSQRAGMEDSALLIPRQPRAAADSALVSGLRRAIRQETKVEISYRDAADKRSRRVIWPFALAYFDRALIVMSWCERRGDFRHFRADRVRSWVFMDIKYPRKRSDLLREWQARQDIPFEAYDL